MELTPEIRQRLRSAMEKRGETGYTLNCKLGISASTIGNYIKDNSHTKKADNTKLSIICKALGITMLWLEFGSTTVESAPEIPTERNEKVPELDLLQQLLQGIYVSHEQLNQIRREIYSLQQKTLEFEKRFASMEQRLSKLKK